MLMYLLNLVYRLINLCLLKLKIKKSGAIIYYITNKRKIKAKVR